VLAPHGVKLASRGVEGVANGDVQILLGLSRNHQLRGWENQLDPDVIALPLVMVRGVHLDMAARDVVSE
jgi:hypothetical protein